MLKDLWNRLQAVGRRVNGEDGQALVELAVSMTLLMLICLGAVEFGRFDYTAIEVSNAARAAAQYAAMNGGNTGDTTSITSAAQNDSANLGSGVTASTPTTSCVCSTDETTAVTCSNSTTCASGGYLMETVTVRTTGTYTPLFSLGGLLPSAGVTLRGYAQQEVLPK